MYRIRASVVYCRLHSVHNLKFFIYLSTVSTYNTASPKIIWYKLKRFTKFKLDPLLLSAHKSFQINLGHTVHIFISRYLGFCPYLINSKNG